MCVRFAEARVPRLAVAKKKGGKRWMCVCVFKRQEGLKEEDRCAPEAIREGRANWDQLHAHVRGLQLRNKYGYTDLSSDASPTSNIPTKKNTDTYRCRGSAFIACGSMLYTIVYAFSVNAASFLSNMQSPVFSFLQLLYLYGYQGHHSTHHAKRHSKQRILLCLCHVVQRNHSQGRPQRL